MAGLILRKRPSGKWEYSFEIAPVDGKRKRYSESGFRTKAEAITAGSEALKEYLNTGAAKKPCELSFSDFLDEWMRDYVSINCKYSTQTGYRKRIERYVKPRLGKYYLRSLNAACIQQFLNEMFNTGLSRNTLSNIKGNLTGSLDYAVRLGYIKFNPALSTRLPLPRAVPDVPSEECPHIVITEEQWKMIMKRYPIGHPSHLPLMIGYYAGLRIGEAFGLCWEDIDFKTGMLTVNRQLQYREDVNVSGGKRQRRSQLQPIYLTMPKYDSVRSLLLPDLLLSELRAYKDELSSSSADYGEYFTEYSTDASGNVVPSPVGLPGNHHFVMVRKNGTLIRPRTMAQVNRVVSHDLGITDFDYHSLRKTHCTMLLDHGANPKDVQKRLGHKTLKETMEIYASVTRNMEEMSVDILNRIAEKSTS